MENQNETLTKKKGNKSKIIIVLLIVVVLGLVCYICYDKGIIFSNKETSADTNEKAKNNKQNATKNDKEESVEFSDRELEEYVNYISPISYGPSASIYNTSYVNAKNLSSADKIEYIGSHVFDKHTSTSDYRYEIISENDVKNEVEKIYGPNTYEKATFNLGCGDYILNENEGNYYSKTGCGGTTDTSASNVVIDYKATKSKLEITTAYAIFSGSTKKIYKDYNKSIPLDDNNYTGNDISEFESYMKEYVKNNKDRLYHIVYTFESNNGRNYYFKEFKNNKQ